MKKSLLIIISLSILIACSSGWYYLSSKNHKQEAIDTIAREITVFKSLGFDTSSEIISTLSDFVHELQTNTEESARWSFVQSENIDAKDFDVLVTVNKKMLKSYMKDLQEYRKLGVPTTSTIVRFSYDKVVRLTIALAELEKSRVEGLPTIEYRKKVERMREITKQSITHSKTTLRDYLHDGIKQDSKINAEREYVTRKVRDLVALDRVVYL